MVFVKYSADIENLATQKGLDGQPLLAINTDLRRRISKRSMYRWKSLYRATDSAVRDPATYQPRGRPSSFDTDELVVMCDLVKNTPSLFLEEIQKRMLDLTGKRVALSTIARDLHKRLGLSLLMSRRVHFLQSAENRAAYVARVAGIPAEYLVFIGECSFHCTFYASFHS